MVLYEWSIESLGLFDLKRIITIRPIGVWHQKYCRSFREQTAPHAFESLSRYFDVIERSVCAALLQIQCTYGQWFTHAKWSPNSFKTCIKKLNDSVCCSKTNSSALSLYFRWQNWAKQTCCIRSLSHLHSCDIALSLLLMWYCLTIWCTYETKTQTGTFLLHILNFRDILTTFSRLHHAVSCWSASYLSSINCMKCQMTHIGLGQGKCVNKFNALFFTAIN